jgi:hypothetical protein
MTHSGRIGTYSFRVLTELISESYDLSISTLKYLNGVSTNIYNTDINDRKLVVANFKSCILKTYSSIVFEHIASNISILRAIEALNNHVLQAYGDTYGYETIDDFLLDNYLEVPPTYADLSNLVGFEILEFGEKKCGWRDIEAIYEEIDKSYDLIGWENL